MPSSSVLLGIALPLIYLVASVGLCAALFRERRNPTSYTRRTDDLAWWAELPTEQQAAVDAEAIAEGMVADGFDAAVRARAEERGRQAVQRAANTNALYHL